MAELFEKLGVDWKLLLAQIINFLVLLFILYKLAYKPILKILQERKNTIEQGLHNAKKAEDRLQEVDALAKAKLVDASKEAQRLLDNTQSDAELLRQEKLTETQREAHIILEKTKKEIEREQKQMFEEAKSSVASLVVSATEKVLVKKIDSQEDQRIIEDVVKHL